MHLLTLTAMLGAAQGILLLVLIAVQFRSPKNLPFALLLLGFSLRLGTIPAWNPAAVLRYPAVLTIAGPLPLLFGPLVWWYVRELVCTERGRPRWLWLHAAPWALETIILLVYVASRTPAEYAILVRDLFTPPAPLFMPVRHVGKVLSGGIYAVLAVRLVIKGRYLSDDQDSGRRLLWARVVVAAPLLSLLSFVVVAVHPASEAMPNPASFTPFFVPAIIMMLTVYSFAMLVLVAPGILALGGNRRGGRHEEENGSRSNGGARLSMTQDDVVAVIHKLEAALARGVYRNPELTLSGLAECLAMHPKRLSTAINRHYGESCTRLINQYRLDEFLLRANAGELKRYTILGLAFEVGFPSKSTFNRVFRERLNQAPSQYLAGHMGDESSQ